MKKLIIKRLIVLPFLLLSTHYLYSQIQVRIGYTGGWFFSNTTVSGGPSFFLEQNIIQAPNSSFSISTNIKIGMGDKAGTGVIVPLIVAAAYFAGDNNSYSNVNTDDWHINGGTTHLFVDLPLIVHYNFGLGSNTTSRKNFGFYMGGGISYITTGFTNESGYSRGTNFFGYVMDGGVRFSKNVDVNISNTISLRKPIGPINNPIFSEITLSLHLVSEKQRKHGRRK